MSVEAGLAATAAIESQSTVAVNQAVQAAQQWSMVQNFELSINEAAQGLQTGAATCQQADLICKKIAIQHNDPSAQFIPEMQIWPKGQSNDLGKQIFNYVEQFSQRAKNMDAEMNAAVTKPDRASSPSATAPSEPSDSFSAADALKLMQRSYEFALETYLISNASSLSTRIFNQLMKEQ
jgi:hypothetical protein